MTEMSIRARSLVSVGAAVAGMALPCVALAMSTTAPVRLLQAPAKHDAAAASCVGSPVVAVAAAQKAVEEVAVDVTSSTDSPRLRALYSSVVLAVVDRAAAEEASLRIVALGASGVGARVVFEGSFAPATDDELFNLAATNRARCWARLATARVFDAAGSRSDSGSDVAGTLASLISDARSLTPSGGPVTVTVLTDGCQAPSRSGLNRELTDICGKLAAGRSTTAILASHAGEFTVPDASGVSIVMRGVGVGRLPEAASTRLAQALVGFWTLVCRRAHAKACLIGSDLP